MTTLLELAARVEALDGPCRETDAAIASAVGRPKMMTVGHELLGNRRQVPAVHSRYTGSLDAAMTLVPERWFTSDYHAGPSGGNWWTLSVIRDGDTYYTSTAGIAATPALALTAAALRARAAMVAL